jgi:hypothetical protein
MLALFVSLLLLLLLELDILESYRIFFCVLELTFLPLILGSKELD